MPILLFTLEMLRSPRAMGAIFPSSGTLARHVAAHLPVNMPGKVVELGAGTGAITRALLLRGVPPQELIVVERSRLLAKQLRRRYPLITVAEGDAAHLVGYLQSQHVRAVVSGLPLRSLPLATVRVIMSNVAAALGSGGMFIQFTYHLRAPVAEVPGHFSKVASNIVWRNIPPARVDAFLSRGR
jgi:phosphatidylethanolamine/phosphatidyl-N-methylethanolamine N-methyltransferase